MGLEAPLDVDTGNTASPFAWLYDPGVCQGLCQARYPRLSEIEQLIRERTAGADYAKSQGDELQHWFYLGELNVLGWLAQRMRGYGQ